MSENTLFPEFHEVHYDYRASETSKIFCLSENALANKGLEIIFIWGKQRITFRTNVRIMTGKRF